MELSSQTEKQILEAAEKVFYQKGKGAASMQDIADEAGITRTSLNYYYRSKDKLFEEVFRQTMEHFVPNVAKLLNSERSMSDYLSDMIGVIIDDILEHPQIPIFVLQELTSNPERMPQILKDLGIFQEGAIKKMQGDELEKDLPIDPRHLIMNVLGMSIFPFAAKPMLVSILYDGDEDAYIRAMEERKTILPMIIKQMIKSIEG